MLILSYHLLTIMFGLFLIFQSREAAISFQLIPSIHLSELKYVIKINSLSETSLTDLQKENDTYKTENVNVSHNGKSIYLTLCTCSIRIKESSLSDTKNLIQYILYELDLK